MLPALADVSGLEARLGVTLPEDSIERAQAVAQLEDASTLVRSIAGRTWVDSSNDLLNPIPDPIVMVVLAAAKRAVENPTGIVQKTAGDLSLSFGARSDSAVYITEAERQMILRVVGRNGPQTVSTTRGDTVNDETIWVPVEGSPNTFPLTEQE